MLRSWLVSVIVAATMGTSPTAEAQKVEYRDSLEQVFASLDADHDRRLTLREFLNVTEFLNHPVSPDVLRRDFQLFDWNADQHFSRGEFAATPSVDAQHARGAVPDPFSSILDAAVAAMDESYEDWDVQPDQVVDSTTFTINYLASIATDGRRRLDRRMITHADPDRDRRITRSEAKRFLEIQLGIRWSSGDLLRLPDGRVVDFAKFMTNDLTADDELSPHEVRKMWPDLAAVDDDFARLDRDQDGKVTLPEFAASDGRNLRDPIEFFREADANLDAALDNTELSASLPASHQHLLASNLSGFDADHDGKLSLAEFRLSMLGNHCYPWETILSDLDRDQHLSFTEFEFHPRDHFCLLRRYYFHRLDRDGDGRLSTSEFSFRLQQTYSLHKISVDGEDAREIFRDGDYPMVGSPAVSPDGRWILCDAVSAETGSSVILLMSDEGKDARVLCDASMPSWSADGTQFTALRRDGGGGVWIMNLDGTADKRVDDGRAAVWSPDGGSIAYIKNETLRVYEVRSGQSRELLAAADERSLGGGLCWSPDGTRLAVKINRSGRDQIAVLSVIGEVNLKTCFSTASPLGEVFAWPPEGRRILFSLFSETLQRSRMHEISPVENATPRIIPEASQTLSWLGGCVSRDGKWMVLITTNEGIDKQ